MTVSRTTSQTKLREGVKNIQRGRETMFLGGVQTIFIFFMGRYRPVSTFLGGYRWFYDLLGRVEASFSIQRGVRETLTKIPLKRGKISQKSSFLRGGQSDFFPNSRGGQAFGHQI